MSRSTDQTIVEVASRNHGAVSRAQLVAHGVSDSAVDRRIDGLLKRFASGVFIVGVESQRSVLAAAELVEPRACAAGLTAAELQGLPIRRMQRVAVVVPHNRRPTFPNPVQSRRTRHLPVEDVALVDGLRTTTVERTICDLSIVVSARQLQRLIEWSISSRRMTASSFRACAVGFCRRGRKGSAQIRLLRHDLLDGRPVPASVLEQRGLEMLHRHGMHGFEAHFAPPWFDGLRGIVDVAWPSSRVILELDGRRWHAVTEAQEEDRRRDRKAAENGWIVLRATWDEVVHREESLVTDLRAVIGRRANQTS